MVMSCIHVTANWGKIYRLVIAKTKQLVPTT